MRYEVKSILVFTFIALTAFFFTACVSISSQKNDTSNFTHNTSEQTDILKESNSSSETANISNESINYVQKNNLGEDKR
ncbi:hypothetical protein ACAG39_11760 [Caldicellulosiruptoraceae bacterium PP1]